MPVARSSLLLGVVGGQVAQSTSYGVVASFCTVDGTDPYAHGPSKVLVPQPYSIHKKVIVVIISSVDSPQ